MGGKARITMDVGYTPITLCGIARILPPRQRKQRLKMLRPQRLKMLRPSRHHRFTRRLPSFWPSHEYYTATAYGGCQEDGLDCRYSRCCARQGSRCYVKDHHWASCNESCFSFTQ